MRFGGKGGDRERERERGRGRGGERERGGGGGERERERRIGLERFDKQNMTARQRQRDKCTRMKETWTFSQ